MKLAKHVYRRVNETVHTGILPSGLTVKIIPKQGFAKKSGRVRCEVRQRPQTLRRSKRQRRHHAPRHSPLHRAHALRIRRR
ncbi:MAG: hypothetical protein MZU97_25200 [Bacillus subtilis]|nr:hypothetical protein [Bacillus subtilis]